MDIDTKLTDEQIDAIASTMEEVKSDSEDLQIIADLPSNNGVEASETPQEGYSEKVTLTINPDTGETMPVASPPSEEEEKDIFDLSFDEMIERSSKNLDELDEHMEITEEDVADQIKNNEDVLVDFDISRDGIIQVLRVVQQVQHKEKINIYKELPPEVQKRIDQYVVSIGYPVGTNDYREVRNSISEMLINDFISNISLQKYASDFEKEMNALQNKVNEEFSKMYMDYDQNRTQYIESVMNQQDDPEKKEAIGAILDAINDGFKLERIKKAAAAHKIKIKKFDLEKPQKIFNSFLLKYKDSTQNIYSVYTAYNTLYRHMKDEVEDPNDILRFFIAICKYCLNYHANNPTEHAFMYYSMYNPILLDVYKGEEYESFAPAYKANVKEIIDLLKKKSESNQNNK